MRGRESRIQALGRSRPALPMMPGMPERRTHDYVRHGATSPFAAMNVADGTVIGATHRRHRAAEFVSFLGKIDAEVPDGLDVHVVCDNYGTHKTPSVNAWLKRHPRFHMHFTPTYSSWLNQVGRLFEEITRRMLQRSDHRSVQALERDVREWVRAWNENPPAVQVDQDRRPDPLLPRLIPPVHHRHLDHRIQQRTSNAGH